MGKKRRTSSARKTASSSVDVAASREKKVKRLKELQVRRENRKYLKLLNGAENRLLMAQKAKEEAAMKAERYAQELKAAVAHLDLVAKEVSEWENLGVVVETTFTDLEEGAEVIIAHQGDELGVKAVTAKTDPELVYGVAQSSAKKGERVKISKRDFEPSAIGGRFTESAADQEVLDQLDDVVAVPAT